MKINVWPQSKRARIRCFSSLVLFVGFYSLFVLARRVYSLYKFVVSICYSVRCIIIQNKEYKTKNMYSLYLWCLLAVSIRCFSSGGLPQGHKCRLRSLQACARRVQELFMFGTCLITLKDATESLSITLVRARNTR